MSIAPRSAYVAIAETNAAVASRLLGDDDAYRLQLSRAWDILRGEKWGSADAQERVALTNFMIEAGRALPTDVRKAMMMYRSLRAKVDRSNALEEDRRVAAFEAVADGHVCESLNERADAIRHYQRSLELWSQLGFGMRAALVALDLRRLTADERYQAPLDDALKRAPNAWFARGRAPGSAQRGMLNGLLRRGRLKAKAVRRK